MTREVYQVGQSVRIKSLKKNGILVAALSAAQKETLWKCAIGNLTIKVKESDLEPIVAGKKKSHQDKFTPLVSGRLRQKKSIDLHGLTVAEAIEQLDLFISQAVLSEIDSVEVVHGIGSGAISKAVQKRLAQLQVVKHFTIDDNNRGVTKVYF